MTLSRKLFRPWELPIPGNSEPISSREILNLEKAEDVIDIKFDGNKLSTNSESCRTLEEKVSERDISLDSRPKYGTYQFLNPKEDGNLVDNLKDFIRSSSVTSSAPNTPIDWIDTQYFSTSHFLTPSPSSSQAHSSDNNNIFLYPTSINDLANLSKSELRVMGLLPPELSTHSKVKRQRPKRFRCPHCQVAFSNNGQLKGHVRIHTGERPFVCEEESCGKSFTRNEELTRHRRIHSGLRPFPCGYCGKKFGRKDHLKKHTRTHERGLYNSGNILIGYNSNPFQPLHHPHPPPFLGDTSKSPPFALLPPPTSLPTSSGFDQPPIPPPASLTPSIEFPFTPNTHKFFSF